MTVESGQARVIDTAEGPAMAWALPTVDSTNGSGTLEFL